MPVEFVTSYHEYVPNPGSDVTPLSPCVDPEMTPQLVCGTVNTSAAGEDLTESEWVQLDFVGAGANTAKAFNNGTPLMVRRATVGFPTTNTAAVTFGPNSGANAETGGIGQTGFVIPSAPGTSYDLNAWHAKSTDANQLMTILYQPAS